MTADNAAKTKTANKALFRRFVLFFTRIMLQ